MSASATLRRRRSWKRRSPSITRSPRCALPSRAATRSHSGALPTRTHGSTRSTVPTIRCSSTINMRLSPRTSECSTPSYADKHGKTNRRPQINSNERKGRNESQTFLASTFSFLLFISWQVCSVTVNVVGVSIGWRPDARQSIVSLIFDRSRGYQFAHTHRDPQPRSDIRAGAGGDRAPFDGASHHGGDAC